MTGIEPALSAWEAVPSGPVAWPDLRDGLSASDRERPFFTGVNGPLMARRPRGSICRPPLLQAEHIPSWRGWCERYALSPVADGSWWSLLLLSAARGERDRWAPKGRLRSGSPLCSAQDGSSSGFHYSQYRCEKRGGGGATSFEMVYEMATSRPVSI